MSKVIELVIIASVIAIACSGTFEFAKDRFLRLSSIWKGVILAGLFGLAGALAFSMENVPTFEQTHFVIPIPVLSLNQFRMNEITITTHAPLVPCIIFGIFIAFLAITDTFGPNAVADEDANGPKGIASTGLHSYMRSRLLFYPMLALGYKFYVLPHEDPSHGDASAICLTFSFILGILILPLIRGRIEGALRWSILVLFSIFYAGAISLAALL
jgi:hypothetical protein